MFVTRLISGVVLVAITLLMMIPGGWVLTVFLGLVSLIGLFEFYRAFGMEKSLPAAAGYLATALLYGFLLFGREEWTLPLLTGLILLLMSVYVLGWSRFQAEDVMQAFFGVFYVSVLLMHIALVRSLDEGIYLVWLIYLSAWGSDTSAYCVGRLIGKHRLAPNLSPKKSIEGSVGGIVGAGLLGLLFGAVFADSLTLFSHPALFCMILCAAGSVIAQIGDLSASGIKRNRGIKDFGNLIPGHGGILDRFDSILFTAPVVYYLILILR